MQKYVWAPDSAGHNLENLCLKYTIDSMTFY